MDGDLCRESKVYNCTLFIALPCQMSNFSYIKEEENSMVHVSSA